MDGDVKRLSILGSTGSVGNQTLEVVRAFPEQFNVVGLASNTNREGIINQSKEFHPDFVACNNFNLADTAILPKNTKITDLAGVAAADNVDIVVAATAGYAALPHTFHAINLGRNIAIANKETIVMAGSKLTEQASIRGCKLLPLDSEPNAIWQCLRGEDSPVSRLFITASGGAFRDRALDSFSKVTPAEALEHPTWKMGPKITIDSATLMNKVFEVIEAKWLFNIHWDDIEVIIHPESIIHSMVEFDDGSLKAQMSIPDMKLPIQYALFYPDRPKNDAIQKLDPVELRSLTFKEIDHNKYPCFNMALKFAKMGGSMPSALCGADEAAVEEFLSGRISFTEIHQVIENTLEQHLIIPDPSLTDMIDSAKWAETKVRQLVGN